MASAVGARYAKALVDAATRPGAEAPPEQIAAQLKAFEEVCRESAGLRNILLSPAVPGARKRAVVSRLAGALGLSRLACNFLYVLIDHRRLAAMAPIREAYEALLDERTGVVRVEVEAAGELPEAQKDALQKELSLLTGRQARAKFAVDPGLLGGAVARIGSTIYDGSVKGQLQALRRQLRGE